MGVQYNAYHRIPSIRLLGSKSKSKSTKRLKRTINSVDGLPDLLKYSQEFKIRLVLICDVVIALA